MALCFTRALLKYYQDVQEQLEEGEIQNYFDSDIDDNHLDSGWQ